METQQEQQDVSLGSQLQQAREVKRFTLEVAAERLRLSPDILARIETDNYDSFPGLTYVRGYLRAYARLLEVSPEKVIDQFNRLGLSETREHTVEPQFVHGVTNRSRRLPLSRGKIIGIAAAAVVIGLAVCWYSYHPDAAPVAEEGGLVSQTLELQQ